MRILVLILCVSFIPTISYAAPSIGNVSGTINHGKYINISGTGFGTKSPAKPLVWADFEGGSVAENSSLSSGTLTVDDDGSDYLINTTNLPHTRSKKNVAGKAMTNAVKTPSGLYVDYSGSPSYFFFVRRKFPAGIFRVVGNLKLAHANVLPITPMTGIHTTINYHNFSSPFKPDSPAKGLAIVHQTADGVGARTPLADDGAWHMWEVQERRGSIDTYNGPLKWWVDGVVKRNENRLNRTTKYPAENYNSIQMVNYWQYTGSDAASYINNALDYIDDLYIDSTWSRVMIGNASTFNACTHREPLIPTEWSPTAITAYFNQGSFSNGESVYVFVVDSDGNASPGMKITIGATADFISPPNSSFPIPNPPERLNIK